LQPRCNLAALTRAHALCSRCPESTARYSMAPCVQDNSDPEDASGDIDPEAVQQRITALRLTSQQQALRTSRLERRERLLEEQRLEVDDVKQRSLLSAAVGPEAAAEARATRLAESRPCSRC